MTHDTSFSPRRRRVAAGLGALLAAPGLAGAQTAPGARWKPERPITIYNPFAVGGITDLHLRLIGERVGKVLGQQVLVEARAGAAGTLAPAALRGVKPDGHTLACYTINSLRYPHYQQVSWHPLNDFSFITGLSSYTFALVVKADSPWKTVEDLFAAGKADPEKYTYGTSGIGGSGHLMMIEIEQKLGAKFTHVPYKGGAEWMQALLAGQIHFLADASQWGPFVDDGRCRILAMVTEQRLSRYANVPTLKERGVDVVGQSPYGLVGPKDLPPAIVQSLYDAFNEANNEPATLELLGRYIQVPWNRNPTEYRAFAENYYNGVRPLLVKAGLAKG
jgi:tripartite-type tricarboxylate transporter receptor subunit TctC